MKYLKLFGLSLLIFTKMAVAADVSGTYGLHLFFDEKEYVDVLTIDKDENGKITGHMFVPDDFEGEIENVLMMGGQMRFDLFVPKNSARPKDLIFSYRVLFHSEQYNEFIGFVTLKGRKEFVASFVGFRR